MKTRHLHFARSKGPLLFLVHATDHHIMLVTVDGDVALNRDCFGGRIHVTLLIDDGGAWIFELKGTPTDTGSSTGGWSPRLEIRWVAK